MFYGEFKRHLDAKGRVMIPAEYRSLIGESVYITLGLDHNLMIFQPAVYEQVLNNILQMNIFDSNARRIRRMFLSKARLQTVDKNARIRIPSELSAAIDLPSGSDIILAGNGHYIEVWREEEWDELNISLVDPEQNELRYEKFQMVLQTPIQHTMPNSPTEQETTTRPE
ncbi:MAG: hypothetical protein J7K85_09055 [Anaerolineaceae bacterium]|nr:hypothetical protein [Anaerolineaceae bacterium]